MIPGGAAVFRTTRTCAGAAGCAAASDQSEREGYVPNVVYSCGSMLHGETVVLPYGCSDSTVRVATVDLRLLLGRLVPG